ncbi:hypothetical protein SKAU_G00115950 [Synaphobranchus kaupii]|uniref:G-protein coupled receptors family 1 profile domain-containing protein n=1 Tax=Synaphobranchus kaupii TaxID=118154 RepID=A0A9Q1J0Y9_SYNKA|nr:hypothetical protein SKAU_G00115950 [Synaphobranchus kaupii]
MTEPDHHELFADFQRRFLPPVFGVEFCVALAGNVGALWLMAGRERRRNWHTGLVFSCNLAASDLLYTLTLPLLVLYYAGGKHWRFGPAACTAERFLFICNLYSSVFFVTCISVNRYVGIVHPFFARSHVRPRHATAVSLLVWVAVAAVSSPVLSVFLAVFGCLLPLLATAASYGAIFRTVWRKGNFPRAEKRKVGLLLGAVLTLYAVSFVPYHALRNYHLYLKIEEQYVPVVYKAYQVSKGLVTLNMCLHPLLYMTLISSSCGGPEDWGDQSPGGQRLRQTPKPIRDPTIQGVRKTGGQK